MIAVTLEGGGGDEGEGQGEEDAAASFGLQGPQEMQKSVVVHEHDTAPEQGSEAHNKQVKSTLKNPETT